MQRHEHLKPLSREHHLGLSISQKARSLADDTPKDVQLQHWQQLIDYVNDSELAHFWVEEKFLVQPLLDKLQQLANSNDTDNEKNQQLAKQILTEHQQLEDLAKITEPTLDNVRTLGDLLYQHIRFEERQVFTLAQELLSKEELQAIFDASTEKAKHPYSADNDK